MSDFCPWLGYEEDRQVRQAEPSEEHVCYAQRQPGDIEIEYQEQICLTADHRMCRFYLEPPPAAPPEPMEAEEDEVGPPLHRFPTLQLMLWGLVVVGVVAVLYFYGSALLAPLNLPGASAGADSSATPPPAASEVGVVSAPAATEAAPQTGAAAVQSTPEPGLSLPTATPTPYPGGRIYSLRPAAGMAGWVASDEARGNHLGDSYLYAGVFDGVIYHALIQFDLSAVPRGATIYAGTVELTGLDARRLGGSGTWEVRVLGADGGANSGGDLGETWSRTTYQDAHNAAVEWSLPPAMAAGNLAADQTYAFALSTEQLRDLEQRLMDEQYTVSLRVDGPLAGESSLFAWDSGSGPASKGNGPKLLLSVGAAPKTPIPTGPLPPTNTPTPSMTPTPTETPVWFVVTSTPTPQNAMTAAAVALRATALATTTGTPTPLPPFVATATPLYVVVTRTPTPENYATATFRRGVATANVLLTGTPTPTPENLATATFTPRPWSTPTPVYLWLDEMENAPTPTATPIPRIPARLKGKILFLSDRSGRTEAYMLDPASGRVALLTARWPYDEAEAREHVSPDGEARAFVQNDGRNVPQVYIYSQYYGGTWQVTFNAGQSYDPVWSPDGNRLAFVSTADGNDEVFVVGADGKGQKRLTQNQWEWDKHPTWSPDGSQIVFWSNQGTGRSQLWIIDADGKGRRMLLESPYNDWDPVWVK